jgi:hypothetical protein
MKRIISALAMVTAAAVGIAGCGGDDDDDTSNPTAGKSSTGGEPGTNGGTAASNGGEPGTNGGAPSGNVTCDATAEGVCQNATDCPFVVDGTARLTSGTCGKGCIGKVETCSRDCITAELEMTDECATCYADTVNCTIANCAQVCIQDPEADVCKQCQVEAGCREAFDECSGLPG